MTNITLNGKITITGEILAETGLHIGGASTGLDIGGVDSVVVRDSVSGLPYIPGSSLKGKMRGLLERALGKPQNKEVRKEEPRISIHECKNENEYQTCEVCKIFGITPDDKQFASPTRLIVRDAKLTEESKKLLEKVKTDLPYSEVKWEAVIDRITSAAMPRQIERVPAGAKFTFEMIYNVFEEQDKSNLKKLFEAMNILEDDYLGGHGSRGYGQVKFDEIKINWNPKSYYESGDKSNQVPLNITEKNVETILQNFNALINKIA